MPTLTKIYLILATIVLTACTNLPTAPSVMTLPGTGKSFDQFLTDDQACQQFAYTHIGGKSGKTAHAVSSTTQTRYYSAGNLSYVAQQYRYDMSYIQCMYAKGHRVPVSGQITSSKSTKNRTTTLNSTSGFTPPPPPKGMPPPPPPSSSY